MKFSFRFGDERLTPEQRAVVERLERGEISEAEAEGLLGAGADVRVFEWRVGGASNDGRSGEASEPSESPEDAKAREMIERIAQEVDAETGG